MDVASIFRKLTGGTEPAPAFTPAPPLSNYPTPEDAMFARQSGFDYGTPLEAYTQGNAARVIGQPGRTGFTPGSVLGLGLREAAGAGRNENLARNLDLTDPANAAVKESIGTLLAQASLAANRVPVAALGFDPSIAALDTRLKNVNVAGAYSPDQDSMFAMTGSQDPSTIVHESAHRGMKQLRADPALKDIFKALPSEEYVVRYLMAKQAGDPEKGGGEAGDKQREFALKLLGSGHYTSALEKLDRAAQDAIAKRRPGGPR